MSAGEVVKPEMQRQCGPQILLLLRERISEAGWPLAPLAQRTVLPLDVRRSGLLKIRVAALNGLFNRYKIARAVPFAAFLCLAVPLDAALAVVAPP